MVNSDYDEKCVGCVIRRITEMIIDDYPTNREELITILFNFQSKAPSEILYYNSKNKDILKKLYDSITELEDMITSGSSKEDLLYKLQILILENSLIQDREYEQIDKLIISSGVNKIR